MSLAGLVLAAGRSSRFGTDKAMAVLDGRTLLDHAVLYIQGACDVVAVNAPPHAPAADRAAGLGLEVISDRPSDPRGPLAGLNAGLHWARDLGMEFLLITPCDTPRVPPTVAKALAGRQRAAVIRTASGLQPLHSIWRIDSSIEALAAAFATRRHPAVHDLLQSLDAEEIFHEDDGAFVNVNLVDDLSLLTNSASTPT